MWALLRSTLLATLAVLGLATPSRALVTEQIASDTAMNALIESHVFVAEGRIGNRATNGTFELDLGQNTSAPAVTKQYVWPNGTAVPFTLSFDGTTATFQAGGHALSYVPTGAIEEIFVRTRAATVNTSILVDNLVLNGEAVGAISQAVNASGGLDILRIAGFTLSPGFTLTGQARMSWGSPAPSNSNLAFQVKVVSTVGSPAPPTVAITSPANAAQLGSSAVAVSGTVSAGATVSVNGQAASVTGTSWSTTLTLADGTHTLTATATSSAGSASSSVSVTVDTLAPQVVITAPVDGSLTSQTSVALSGTVTDASPVTSVLISGASFPVTAGAFSGTVALVEGANTLTVTATDAAGNTGQASVGVTGDTTPPVVSISTPANGSETPEATVFVVGTVADASPIVALTIDGDPIAPGASFDVSAALTEGANTITVAATDTAGNVGSASTTVIRQSAELLAVTITSPPDGSLVSQGRIAVAGSVTPAGASVVVNGVHATVTGESFTAAAVPLEEGPNTLTATATRAGASVSDSTGVTLNLPPEISITSPLDGAVVRAEATDVEGFVSDPLALVDVNGIAARVDSGGRFVAEDVTLDAGPNDLVARAIDLEGAQASDRAAVVRDDAAGPAVRVVLGFLYNFHPYPAEPDQFLLDPNTRLVTFSSTDEWLAAMAAIGRPASAFLPAADLPVVRGHSDSVWAFVLSEAPEEPSLDFVFPDGHASDYITSDYQGSGPAAEIRGHPIFELLAPSQLVSPEALAPSDFEAAYYHIFLITRPVDVPDGPSSAPPPYSAPLVIRASQGVGSDSITVFWDEQDAFAEVVAPSPAFARVSGASVEASGTALEEHVLAAATYRVLNLSGGAGAIDLGPGEGTLGDGRFRIADAPLGAGENVLFVNVHDGTSWSDGVAVAIERDPSAPDVQLVFPRDGEALTAESASLSLNFGVPLTLVSVNGASDGRAFPVGLAEDVVSVPLVPGPNPIEVVVDDGSGELPFTFVLYRVATLDPPRITSPAHRSFVNTDTMVVEGVVPLGTPYVEVNGVPGTIDPGGVRFTATIPVPRDLGFYLPGIDVVARPLVVTAVAYPQGTSASIEVTPDFAPPEFRLVLPEDGAATLEEAVAYGGWLSEAATVTLTHAGGEQVRTTLRDRAREGEDLLNFFGGIQFHRFDFEPVPVSTGPNTVTLTARDRAGNESSVTLDVERFAAALALASPTAPVPAPATDLVFDVVAPVTLQGMFVNGRFLPSTRSLAFAAGTATIANVPLEPGTNALRLVYEQVGGLQQALNATVESSSTAASIVTGTVVDPETGQGIWGALVALEVNGQTILVATAPDGTFRVVVAPGQVVGTVTALGYAGATFDVTVSGGETVNTQVTLAPTGSEGAPPRPEEVELLATVRDAATSAPVEGVTAEVLGDRAIDVTDAAGLAELSDVQVGDQTLRFRRRGFLDAFATRRIDAPATGATVSETFDIAWVASEFGTLAIDTNAEGTVLDGLTLRPLAGARVEARDVVTTQLVGTTVADAQGRFTLAALPKFKTLEVTATHPDHAAQTIEAFVVPRGDESLDFHLRSSGVGRIEGTITDASTGLPITLARVGLPGAPLRTVSEGDGLFVLMNAPAGSYDLAVSHPAYFSATITGVAVSSGGTSTASAALQPRPKTGGIYGVVRRAAGDLPVPGATIVASSGPSATADAEGKFALSGLPTGLEEFTVSAPGFTPRVKTAVVDADVDALTPTQRYVEFDLSATPLEASADIAIEGGSIELPDASVRIDFPPLALSGDARVTLLRRAAPQVGSGDTLAMDPALSIDGDVATLGEEFVIRIESATPGATAPFFVGPILVSGRYSAAAAAALGGREDVAFPVYYDADQSHWTVPRVVPYLHLVDTVNRLSVTGLSMLVTETGAPVTARLVSPDPIQLAGFADLPVIRQAREIVIALAKKIQPLLGIDRFADLRVLNPEFFEHPDSPGPIAEPNRWDQNARPLFVFHGWDPSSVLVDSSIMSNGAILEGRYGTIMRDFAAKTDGVYRPAFATYNTRAGVEEIGNLVSARVEAEEGGALRGLPSDPLDPSTGPLFGSYDSFGFSMGGLIERAYQRQVNGSPRQIKSMITMGTPHHGGLPLLRDMLAGNLRERTGFLPRALSRVGIEALLALWSPGTADLLDYDEFNCRFGDPEFSGNPTLCRMNRDRLTAPSHRLSLIAGTDSIRLSGLFDQFVSVLDEDRFREVVEKIGDFILDAKVGDVSIDDAASEGFALTGCTQSDGVVCVWSAHARAGPTGGDVTVPALEGSLAKRPSLRDFNHHDGGSSEQSIDEFADEDIIETLTDHYVGRLQELHFVEPTESEPGEVRFTVDVEYNAPNGAITALVPVVYGRYEDPPGQFAWKLLAGADADGEPDSEAVHEIDPARQNSVGGTEPERLSVEETLPVIDPTDPSTRIDDVRRVVVGIGPSQPTVPIEPPEDGFNLSFPPEP